MSRNTLPLTPRSGGRCLATCVTSGGRLTHEIASHYLEKHDDLYVIHLSDLTVGPLAELRRRVCITLTKKEDDEYILSG